MHSNKENLVDEAVAGHIYAVIGLKDTTTGDTLCDPQNPIVLESMTFLTRSSRSPSSPSRRRTRRSSPGDPEAGRGGPDVPGLLDDETGQTIIAGMGELHLEVLVNRMKSDYKVEANIGKPQVAYRETIKKAVEKFEYTHKKQTGGSGQFARVIIKLEPLTSGDGALYEFENKVTGGRVPRSTSRRSTPVPRTPCSTASRPATPWSV